MIACIFGAFTIRRFSVVLGTLVVGWAFPAVCAAHAYPVPCGQKSEGPCLIRTTPIHKGSKGFELSLLIGPHFLATYGGVVRLNTVTGILSRRIGHATESDDYSFTGNKEHPLHLGTGKSTRPLQFAEISGRFAHHRGSINMTFHAMGPARHVSVPKGCTGHAGERQSGTLSGSYTLHADKLGTITQRSFKATMSDAYWTCKSSEQHGYEVQTTGPGWITPAWVGASKNSSNSVSETIYVLEGGGNKAWSFRHTYTVSGLPSSDYTLDTSKLDSGRVIGGGGISGSAMYSSAKSSTHHTTGSMSGSLAVTFASIGQVTAFPSPRTAEETHGELIP